MKLNDNRGTTKAFIARNRSRETKDTTKKINFREENIRMWKSGRIMT